jgi:ribonuclease BN (tRNA processing enzyme)
MARFYLIDAGGGVTHRLVQSGYAFRELGEIFITPPQP